MLPPACFLTGPGPAPAPGEVALLPDFVDDRMADALLDAVLGSSRGGRGATAAATTTTAPPGGADPGGAPASAPPAPALGPGWKAAAGRAVKAVGGSVLGSTLIPAPLPAWAGGLFARLAAAGVRFGEAGEGEGGGDTAATTANHCLINCYPPGAGILAHTDGPAYAPTAAILSLGDDSPAVIRFHASAGAAGDTAAAAAPAFSVFLPPRSLLVFRGGAYTAHMHGIDAAGSDEVGASVLNREAAAAWWAQQRGGAGGQLSPPPASTLSIPRGPLRVSLTVRRVRRVRAGMLRL
jgi:alkylated DNA repair protein alkB family protein 6